MRNEDKRNIRQRYFRDQHGEGDLMSKQAESEFQAVSHIPSLDNVLVLKGGPGTGKTSLLARRISSLIKESRLNPEEFLFLCMGRKDPGYIRKEIACRVGEEAANKVNIYTFHSLCEFLLENFAGKCGMPFKRKKFLDDSNWRIFLETFLNKSIKLGSKAIGSDLGRGSLEELVGLLRGNDFNASNAAEAYGVNEEFIDVLKEYMDENGIYRYNDLLPLTQELIKRSSQGNGHHHLIPLLYNCKALFVDEFHNVYPSLLQMVQLIRNYPTASSLTATKHLSLAGDANQSIFQFLGAEPDLMLNIETVFEAVDVQKINLPCTYRVSQETLAMLEQVCTSSYGKDNSSILLLSFTDLGYSPIIHSHLSNKDEYIFIANEISRLICELGGLILFCDIGILTKTNKEVMEIENFLENNYGILCNKTLLSKYFYHIALLFDILIFSSQGIGSEFSLLALLYVLDRAPGNSNRIAKLFSMCWDWSSQNNDRSKPLERYLNWGLSRLCFDTNLKCHLKEDLRTKYDISIIYKLTRFSDDLYHLKNFFESCISFRKDLENTYDQRPYSIMRGLHNILSRLNLLTFINGANPIKSYRKNLLHPLLDRQHKEKLYSDLYSFYELMEISYNSYIKSGASESTRFVDFFLNNYHEEMINEDFDRVTLSTIHGAKSLEIPIVFIPGAQKNVNTRAFWDDIIFASKKVFHPNKEKLFYVACTRARNLLYVGTSHPKNGLNECPLFTCKFPRLDLPSKVGKEKSLLEALASDWKRKTPPVYKINRGYQLYKRLADVGLLGRNSHGSVRMLHTNSIISRMASGTINIIRFTRY